MIDGGIDLFPNFASRLLPIEQAPRVPSRQGLTESVTSRVFINRSRFLSTVGRTTKSDTVSAVGDAGIKLSNVGEMRERELNP
jgi:hypothetical protein